MAIRRRPKVRCRDRLKIARRQVQRPLNVGREPMALRAARQRGGESTANLRAVGFPRRTVCKGIAGNEGSRLRGKEHCVDCPKREMVLKTL